MRQLSIKAVKASKLAKEGEEKDPFVTPYVVIEIDEPSQRFRSEPGSVDGKICQWNQECIL